MSSVNVRRSAPVILCAGIAVQDIVMRVEQFPAPGSKVPASDFIVTGGGCAANAAVAIARLGGQVRFAGPLGSPADPASQRIIADLVREGINCDDVVRVAGGSASVSLILIDAAGEKTIATRRGEKLAAALPTAPERAIASADAVLVDNRFPEFVWPICQAARGRGIMLVIDADKATTEDDPLLGLGTHVIFSAECLRGTTGLENLAGGLSRMAGRLGGILGVTDGENGVLWLDHGRECRSPTFPIAAIDTLGAGDTFHGALTLALAEGRELAAAMRFATAAAAIKCTHFGGISGTPTRSEVEQYLASH